MRILIFFHSVPQIKKKAFHVKTLFVDLVHCVKMNDFFFFFFQNLENGSQEIKCPLPPQGFSSRNTNYDKEDRVTDGKKWPVAVKKEEGAQQNKYI